MSGGSSCDCCACFLRMLQSDPGHIAEIWGNVIYIILVSSGPSANLPGAIPFVPGGMIPCHFTCLFEAAPTISEARERRSSKRGSAGALEERMRVPRPAPGGCVFPCPAPGRRGRAARSLPEGGTPAPCFLSPGAQRAWVKMVTWGGGQELTSILSIGERTVF